MFNSARLPLKGFIGVIFLRKSPAPKFYPLPFSLKFCTSTSDSNSFTVSYLINNLGFTPESTLKASKRLRFKNSQKPDSVVSFFRNHGFSDSQMSSIVTRCPQLLSCNPHKIVLPKFEFLASKGASSSDIVLAVCRRPRFLSSSLEETIIPTFELVRRFVQSDKKALNCVIGWPDFFDKKNCGKQNVKLLRDEGVRESSIAYLFRMRASVLHDHDLRKTVDEVKALGFDPLKSIFTVALVAKRVVPKPLWDEKVDAFKSWGWSEEAISDAFRRHPHCMLASKDKINAVMRFWVNQLGWNSLDLVMYPVLFGFSLEKRIIPRALVVHYLLAKGLRNKNASLLTPFVMSEKLFLESYVKHFKVETAQLLKLYQEKMNVQDKREDVASVSYQIVSR